jgi:serine/threonine protein kinase
LLIAGTRLADRYLIVRIIRSGGMGAVYEARDERLAEAPCAVKEMLPHHAVGGEEAAFLKRRFEEEMAILAHLSHPSIPSVRDYFILDGIGYIVMDLVHGESLYEIMQRAGGALPPSRVIEIGVELLQTLEYLHEREPPVLHRDIKPENVMIEAGRVRLIDFGIARSLDGESGTQTAVGTLNYASIEQLQGRAEVRSDIYSVGATLFHALTGQMPVTLEIPPLDEVVEGVHPALGAVIDKALMMQRAARFPSARAMREALEALPEEARAPLPVLAPDLGRGGYDEGSPTLVPLRAGSPDTAERPGGEASETRRRSGTPGAAASLVEELPPSAEASDPPPFAEEPSETEGADSAQPPPPPALPPVSSLPPTVVEPRPASLARSAPTGVYWPLVLASTMMIALVAGLVYLIAFADRGPSPSSSSVPASKPLTASSSEPSPSPPSEASSTDSPPFALAPFAAAWDSSRHRPPARPKTRPAAALLPKAAEAGPALSGRPASRQYYYEPPAPPPAPHRLTLPPIRSVPLRRPPPGRLTLPPPSSSHRLTLPPTP